MCNYYAHSTANADKSDWQCLCEHLRSVAERAEQFAEVFGAGAWGWEAGRLHDAGKATKAFIARLEGKPARVDHSTFGARLAREHGGPLGLLLSYMIAGHHGGLPDGGIQEGALHYRLNNGKVSEDTTLLHGLDGKRELPMPFRLHPKDHPGFSLAFFTRMIFSCLVDADFLDTEAFCSPEKKADRPVADPDQLTHLKNRLDAHLAELTRNSKPTLVNLTRREILAQCRAKAGLPSQIFSLTVPTGGGKTLSSLSFALDHAVANKQRRIIYAIPFTSIIEQNAAVFQQILGRDAVLEHHCNYKERDEQEDAAYDRRRGLAAENWDAPLVVTTNVQFFESLFSNKPSRCRKLHNIAGSVIVLDEAQAIPTEYLEPCLLALRELVAHYGCSVVLCTATQPALDDQNSLRAALPQILRNHRQPAAAITRPCAGPKWNSSAPCRMKNWPAESPPKTRCCALSPPRRRRAPCSKGCRGKMASITSRPICTLSIDGGLWTRFASGSEPSRSSPVGSFRLRWSRRGSISISPWSTAPWPGSTPSPRRRGAAIAKDG